MQRLSRTGYLTLRQAAEWLGVGSDEAAARRIKRRLQEIEARTGRTLLIDRGTAGYHVTKGVLREVLPEHFPRREVTLTELARRFRGTMAALGRKKREIDKIALQLRELTRRIDAIESTMVDHSQPRSGPIDREGG